MAGLSIESGVGVSGWTGANRAPLMNGNAATEFGVIGEVHPGFNLVSAISIPLESEFGPLGVLTLYSRRQDAFKHRHLRALLAVGSRLAYQMRLDSSGVGRASSLLSIPHQVDFEKELSQPGEVIKEDSACLSDNPDSGTQSVLAGLAAVASADPAVAPAKEHSRPPRSAPGEVPARRLGWMQGPLPSLHFRSRELRHWSIETDIPAA